jgi:hypothetical protein
MEKLTQKYANYFYLVLTYVIIVQLGNSIFAALTNGVQIWDFILMFLSIINVTLLCNSMWNTYKQRFVECKTNLHILRFTIAGLFMYHVFYTGHILGTLIIRDHILNIITIELVLTYIIRSIEHLEELANQFAKDNMFKR